MKQKEGKRKSEGNGNRLGGRAVSRGVDKGEEENRKRVIMLQSSLFPVSLEWAPLIWWCDAWGGGLHRGSSFCRETVMNWRMLL